MHQFFLANFWLQVGVEKRRQFWVFLGPSFPSFDPTALILAGLESPPYPLSYKIYMVRIPWVVSENEEPHKKTRNWQAPWAYHKSRRLTYLFSPRWHRTAQTSSPLDSRPMVSQYGPEATMGVSCTVWHEYVNFLLYLLTLCSMTSLRSHIIANGLTTYGAP